MMHGATTLTVKFTSKKYNIPLTLNPNPLFGGIDLTAKGFTGM